MDEDDIALWLRYTQDVSLLKNRKVNHNHTKNYNQKKCETGYIQTYKENEGKEYSKRDTKQVKKKEYSITQNITSSILYKKSLDSHKICLSLLELRKIKSGKIALLSVDLHGMNKEEAFESLHTFFTRAITRRQKFVLVITGKGKQNQGIGEPKGVLRQAFKRWIVETPLSQLVLAVNDAHQKHGGTGAFYVKLKMRM